MYEYDFGDGWEHEIVVEARSRLPIGLKFGVCLDGQHVCPPEDCGGPGGYADLLSVLADPTHEEHEFLLGWVGGPFDPTEFDLALGQRSPADGALTAGRERSEATPTPWKIHFFHRDERETRARVPIVDYLESVPLKVAAEIHTVNALSCEDAGQWHAR